MDRNIKLKVLIVGKSGVGKSCVLNAFTSGQFDSTHNVTVGMDFKVKKLKIGEDNVSLGIWDTAGLDTFKALTPSFYRNAHGAFLVYDVSDRSSLISLNEWINDLQAYSTRSNVVGVVLGNKIDKPRTVPVEDGEEFAKRHRMMYLESSAKTLEGIDAAFDELVRKILDTPGLWEYEKNEKEKTVIGNTSSDQSTNKCCGYF